MRPAVLQVTLQAYELVALVSAARWVLDGAKGELPADALAQLRAVLDGYDAAVQKAAS